MQIHNLSRSELLEKCLGGFTQNNNESLNGSVWKLLPKTSFSGIHVFKIGVYIALAVFNDGRSRYLDIMKEFLLDLHQQHGFKKVISSGFSMQRDEQRQIPLKRGLQEEMNDYS